jgi:hypothetical protein
MAAKVKNIEEGMKKLELELRELVKNKSPIKNNSAPKVEPARAVEQKEEPAQIREPENSDLIPNAFRTPSQMDSQPGGLTFGSVQQNTRGSLEMGLQGVEVKTDDSTEKKDEKLYQEAKNKYESSGNDRQMFGITQRSNFNETRAELNPTFSQRRIDMVRDTSIGASSGGDKLYEVSMEMTKPQDLNDPNAANRMRKYQPREQ